MAPPPGGQSEDYPYIVTQDYKRSDASNTISLKVGDKGRIRSDHVDPRTNAQWVCVQPPDLPSGEAQKAAWVPKHVVKIGTIRKVTDPLVFKIESPKAPTLSSDIYIDTTNRLIRTVSGLTSAFKIHRKDLPTTPLFLEKVFGTDTDIREFTASYRGVGRAGPQLQALLTGSQDYDVFDVRDAGVNAADDDGEGIYMIIYWDFPGERGKVHIYVGSTTQGFKRRNQQHLQAQKDPNNTSRHYAIARNARKRMMIPLCRLQGLSEESHEMRVAEQIFVCLFESASPQVLSFEEDGWFGEDGNDKDAVVQRVSRYIVHKEEATVLSKMAREVFKKTGWLGGVHKTGKSFGVTGGLNWSSPLTEMQHVRTKWVKTEVPGNFINYRRSGFNVTIVATGENSRLPLVYKKGGHYGDGRVTSIRFTIGKDNPGPPKDARIHVIFEIKTDGVPHAAPLGRLPLVGPFSDWADANSIGLRIEWLENGRTVYRYVQLGQGHIQVEQAPKGAVQGYNVAVAMRSYLLGQRRDFDDSQKPWMIDFGTARIREVYVDHLDRSVRLREITHRRTTVPGPTARSLGEIGRELVNVYGAGHFIRPSQLNYPAFPNGEARERSTQRKACDACRAPKHLGASHGRQTECKKVPNEARCYRCQNLGKPCTFTYDNNLRNNRQLLLAVTNPEEYDKQAHAVVDTATQDY